MSKPFVLSWFERGRDGAYLLPLGQALPTIVSEGFANEIRRKKRLTTAELAAEYHAQSAHIQYWTARTTPTHEAREHARLDTLRRFATMPHHDQEAR